MNLRDIHPHLSRAMGISEGAAKRLVSLYAHASISPLTDYLGLIAERVKVDIKAEIDALVSAGHVIITEGDVCCFYEVSAGVKEHIRLITATGKQVK